MHWYLILLIIRLVFTKDMIALKANKTDFKVEANEEGFINPDNDPNGPWKLDPMDAPGIRENLSYGIINPKTNETFYPASGRHWRFEQHDTLRLLEEGRILFGKREIQSLLIKDISLKL